MQVPWEPHESESILDDGSMSIKVTWEAKNDQNYSNDRRTSDGISHDPSFTESLVNYAESLNAMVQKIIGNIKK